MERHNIYLDNHATTPIDPKVLEAIMDSYKNTPGNPASNDHQFGWAAQKAVEKARAHVAKLIGAQPAEIVFTSGATESNNTALKGCAEVLAPTKNHIIVSEIEHKCILETVKYLKSMGIEVTFLEVTGEGMVDPDELRKNIKPNTGLVSIMYANNEIGTINPIQELGEICRNEGIIFHVDAAQAIGHISVDVKKENIDMLSCSAHKFHGPKGTGFLYVNSELPITLPPLISGGGQEKGFRSGTLNVPGIVGLGKASEIAIADLETNFKVLLALRGTLYQLIAAAVPSIHLNGPAITNMARTSKDLKRLPHNLSIGYPSKRVKATDIIKQMKTIAVSSGSACTSATAEPSHVLTAIKTPSHIRDATIRFGVSRFNTMDEITEAAEKYAKAITKLTR